jgi:Holliday junction resolvase
MRYDKLTETEREFYISARELGFEVIRGGYPDFALISSKVGPFFVEVKNTSCLSDDQDTMIRFLANAGLPSYLSWGGRFPRLGLPIHPVKIREPRCESCSINTTYKRLSHDTDQHYFHKWGSKISRLESELESTERRYQNLVAASKTVLTVLEQLEQFDATIKRLDMSYEEILVATLKERACANLEVTG